MRDIHYSDGRVVPSIIVIDEDNHCEAAGFLRAFWAANPDATLMSPVIGYCSPGGSHRTIAAVVHEVRKFYPNDPIYRRGRLIKG